MPLWRSLDRPLVFTRTLEVHDLCIRVKGIRREIRLQRLENQGLVKSTSSFRHYTLTDLLTQALCFWQTSSLKHHIFRPSPHSDTRFLRDLLTGTPYFWGSSSLRHHISGGKSRQFLTRTLYFCLLGNPFSPRVGTFYLLNKMKIRP